MLVQASSLVLAAAHTATASREVEDRLRIRSTAPSAPASSAAASSGAASASPTDSVEITDPKALIAQWILEYVTGRRAPLIKGGNAGGHGVAGKHGASPAQTPAAPSWSISYTHRETVHEAEATSFVAEGSVKLASGAEISFSLRLAMQRERTETSTLSVRAGEMTDPIVVNLDGAGARLTADRQAFDLDSDGVDETIANLAAGSAWLAQDLNGDGKVNDGRELFGPATGDGFAELAALDQDGNRWIDEGDAAYSRLGLWQDGAFTSLAEAGIGALAVTSVATPFTLEEGGERLGQLRASGVYLREDGGAGVLQQVDLAV